MIDPTSSDDDTIAKLSRPEGVGMCLALYAAAEEEERRKRASGMVSLVEEKEGERKDEDKEDAGAADLQQQRGLSDAPGRDQQLTHVLHNRASSMTKFTQHEVELDVRGNATVSYGTLSWSVVGCAGFGLLV